jgi:hypothetical protein
MTCVNKHDSHWHNSWVALSLFFGAKGAVDVDLKKPWMAPTSITGHN